jgi:hypothetical protein
MLRLFAKKSTDDVATFFMVRKPSKNFSSILGLEGITQQVGPNCFTKAIVWCYGKCAIKDINNFFF